MITSQGYTASEWCQNSPLCLMPLSSVSHAAFPSCQTFTGAAPTSCESLADASKGLGHGLELNHPFKHSPDSSHSLYVVSHPQRGPLLRYLGTTLVVWVSLPLFWGEMEADKPKNGFKFVTGQLTAAGLKLGGCICVTAERGWMWAHIALVQIL